MGSYTTLKVKAIIISLNNFKLHVIIRYQNLDTFKLDVLILYVLYFRSMVITPLALGSDETSLNNYFRSHGLRYFSK